MPSLQRRRESDFRGERLESEIRTPERQLALDKVQSSRKGLMYCNRCQTSFEENSRYCPKCDRKDETGYIRPIPQDLLAQARSRAIDRSKRRLGLI